jgi:hypothetical protein
MEDEYLPNQPSHNTSEHKMKLMERHNAVEDGVTGEELTKGNGDVLVDFKEMEPIRVTSASAQILATGLNPSEGMFHLFFSYRAAARDPIWVSKLYDTLCLEATSSQRQGKRLPLIEKTRFPAKFTCDAFAQQKILNIFWDKACLSDGYPWEGDGTKKGGGFVGAIMQSILFVPVLSSYVDKTDSDKPKGSVHQLLQANDEKQDNVLVEFIVAKFLHEYSREAGETSLLPCSVVLPLILDEKVFADLGNLQKSISMATNTKAFNVLKAAGYSPPSEMIDRAYRDPDAGPHPWSVYGVVKFFLDFQGVLTWKCGENDRDVKECSQRIMAAINNKLSTCKTLTLQLESNNPLAHELRRFIESKFMGHYLCCLDSHGVKSIRALSQLDKSCVKEISSEMALSMNSSKVEQLCKLKQLVCDAKDTKEAQPLRARLDSFFDRNASWSTALTSTCAVDLLMRRQLYLFIMIAGPILMTVIGLYLLLSPTTYTRVFSVGTEPQSYTHRSISTAVLLFTAAIGLGPICMFCSYVGSPRKGRFALAYATYLACFIVQSAGFYGDRANIDYCRFNSFEPNDSSIQNCVTAYAIAFAVREAFFFGMFLITIKRQEYYWDGFCLGVCLMLSCNFIIYGMTQFSIVNVFVTAAVIALVLSLNTLVRVKRRKSLSEARKVVEPDVKQYQVTWEAVKVSAGQTIMTNASLIELWTKDCPGRPMHPVEVSGSKIIIRQDCADFEFLYFLAEFINGPFNDMVSLWCSGGNASGHPDGQPFFNSSNLFKSPPAVNRGPIKSVERSIEKVVVQIMTR